MRKLVLLACVCLGCGGGMTALEPEETEAPAKRFVVKETVHISTFRYVYVIEDTETGREYLYSYNSNGGVHVLPLGGNDERHGRDE